MKKVAMCIRAGGPWALAGAVAVSLPAAFTPAATGQCNNIDPGTAICSTGTESQLGIIGGFTLGCDGAGSDDLTTPEPLDGWLSMAFPFQTGGADVDAVVFRFGTQLPQRPLRGNVAGGDLWILGNVDAPPPPCPQDCEAVANGAIDVPDLLELLQNWGSPHPTCDLDGSGAIAVPDLVDLLSNWGACPTTTVCGQPDITNVLAQICCALEGLESDDSGVQTLQTINFPNVTTSSTEPTWVVFVPRTGLAGLADIDGDGTGDLWHFDGTSGTAFRIARRCDPDPDDTADPPRCLAVSSPNHAFININTDEVGLPGEWTDLDLLNFNDGGSNLGTDYCVDLVNLDNAPDGTNCLNNPALTGVCCKDDLSCNIEIGWQCGIEGGIYAENDSNCFINPFGACSCGPSKGSCLIDLSPNTGCESLACCEVICTNDPACCSFVWDGGCATLAFANVVFCLPDLAPPDPIFIATGPDSTVSPYLDISPDVYASYWTETDGTFGPVGSDDHFNPVGPLGLLETAFSTGFLFFTGGTGPPPAMGRGREVLTSNGFWTGGALGDATMVKQTLTAHVASDVFGGDGIDDTLTGGSFRVALTEGINPNGDSTVDITIEVTQSVQIIGGTAVYDLTYTMTNNSVDEFDTPIAASFELMRQYDGDLFWTGLAGGEWTNDQIGTVWNADMANPRGRYVTMRDPGLPETSYTMSSPDADAYSAGKEGDEPGGGGFIHSAGTAGVVFGNFGLPAPWADNVSPIGTNLDGYSPPQEADAATYLRIPVSMAASEAGVVISLRVTYGSDIPTP